MSRLNAMLLHAVMLLHIVHSSSALHARPASVVRAGGVRASAEDCVSGAERY